MEMNDRMSLGETENAIDLSLLINQRNSTICKDSIRGSDMSMSIQSGMDRMSLEDPQTNPNFRFQTCAAMQEAINEVPAAYTNTLIAKKETTRESSGGMMYIDLEVRETYEEEEPDSPTCEEPVSLVYISSSEESVDSCVEEESKLLQVPQESIRKSSMETNSEPHPDLVEVAYPVSLTQKDSVLATKTGTVIKKCCNCKKSHCLKLYCECFAAGLYCEGCNCRSCHNRTKYEKERQDAYQHIAKKNPQGYHRRALLKEESKTETPTSVRSSVGCNCSKSGCLQKYCECFKLGKKCGPACSCTHCKNCIKPSRGKSRSTTNKSSLAVS